MGFFLLLLFTLLFKNSWISFNRALYRCKYQFNLIVFLRSQVIIFLPNSSPYNIFLRTRPHPVKRVTPNRYKYYFPSLTTNTLDNIIIMYYYCTWCRRILQYIIRFVSHIIYSARSIYYKAGVRLYIWGPLL